MTQEYMKGQLSGLSLMVSKGSAVTGDSGAALLATALREIGRPESHATPNLSLPGLKGLSNEQLRDSALELASQMMALNQQYEQDSLAADYAYRNAVAKTPEEINKAWQASIQADLAVHAREEQGWNTLRVRAEMTLDEMQSRLPDAVIPKDKTTLSIVRMAVRDGMLAGANPLGTTATYFETLAGLLPQVKVPASRGARKR